MFAENSTMLPWTGEMVFRKRGIRPQSCFLADGTSQISSDRGSAVTANGINQTDNIKDGANNLHMHDDVRSLIMFRWRFFI